MMNYIWCAIVLGSIAFSAVRGNVSETINAGIGAATNSVTTTLAFAGIMCMWSGIMKIADKSGMADVIAKVLSPFTRLLLPKLDSKSNAMKMITMNITANLLGMGNAATPLGLQAMEELDKINKTSSDASDEMCIFTVLNTASFQLIPTTIIALRSAAMSDNPTEIILPIWIVSFISLVSAVCAVKLLIRLSRRKKA